MRQRRAEAIWIDSRSRWQVNVQRDGQRKTFTDSTPGKQGKHSAEAKADKWLVRFATEQKLCDAWQMFIDDKRQNVTPQTLDNVMARYKHIVAVIPEQRKLSMITPYDWQKVLDTMSASGLKGSTIGQTQATITEFNAYALRRRWECDEIRSGDLTVPKQSAKGRERTALSESALKALFRLDDTDSEYIYLFQFLPLTGLRIGEARALQWSDIDRNAHVLHLQRALDTKGNISSGKTANAKRTIPLIPQAEAILDEQHALMSRWQLESEYVFADVGTGEALTNNKAERRWAEIAKLIGSENSLHELRHTFISISKNTLPLSLLKQIAGHSSTMDTLKVYAHETDKDHAQSLKLMEQAFADI